MSSGRRIGLKWLAGLRLAAAVVLLLALALDWVGRGAAHLAASADARLVDAQGRAVRAFVALSGLKAVLGVIAGSSVGGLELGDLAEPAHDVTDIAWRVALVSAASAQGARLMLEVSKLRAPDWIAVAGVLMALAARSTALRARLPDLRLDRLGVWLAVVGLAARLLLPLSTMIALGVSGKLTAARVEESSRALEERPIDFPTLEGVSWLDRPAVVAEWLGKHDRAWWKAYTERLVEHTTWLCAAFVLEAVVFPLLSLYLAWQVLRRLGAAMLE